RTEGPRRRALAALVRSAPGPVPDPRCEGALRPLDRARPRGPRDGAAPHGVRPVPRGGREPGAPADGRRPHAPSRGAPHDGGAARLRERPHGRTGSGAAGPGLLRSAIRGDRRAVRKLDEASEGPADLSNKIATQDCYSRGATVTPRSERNSRARSMFFFAPRSSTSSHAPLSVIRPRIML